MGIYDQLSELETEPVKTEKKTPPVKSVSPQQREKKEPKTIPYARTDRAREQPFVSYADLIPPEPDKRRPERYAFQFWADQITRLKRLRQIFNIAKDPEEREETSLSDMVREAIDEYIDKQTKQLKRDERSGE